jgi:hypothetical protein
MSCSSACILVVLVALSSLAGCASSRAAVSHSLAEQVPTGHVAEAPPTDFELEFAPPESSGTKRFTHDHELTGSLHPSSPTRPVDE